MDVDGSIIRELKEEMLAVGVGPEQGLLIELGGFGAEAALGRAQSERLSCDAVPVVRSS